MGIDRRQVLAGLATAPALAAARRVAAQQARGQPTIGNPTLPDPIDRRMRWAIVGLGTFGVGQVIPGFLDARKSRIAALISGNPAKARTIGERHGVARFYGYDTYDRIAADPDIDCIYIVLPVGLHAEYTIRALEAGKHVLCEKPMASSSAECEAMIAAAKAANRQLGVAYRVHFEPNNREALRRIEAGELGAMRFVFRRSRLQRQPRLAPACLAPDQGARRRGLDVRHRHLRAQHLADDAAAGRGRLGQRTRFDARGRRALQGGRGRPRVAPADEERHHRGRVELLLLEPLCLAPALFRREGLDRDAARDHLLRQPDRARRRGRWRRGCPPKMPK
ncbi:MAG: Gfo/Idh/MocA family oxidoreductase [Qipengyuania sp.]|nr:Gfo/Idh/MocA family oxidoreductase [Qipengyuania sp.]